MGVVLTPYEAKTPEIGQSLSMFADGVSSIGVLSILKDFRLSISWQSVRLIV